MGLQILFFSNRCACRGEIVSTMPRRMISSATSRPVHWLIGRPDSSGAAQARETIRHNCSGLIVAGLPGRGASSSRSLMLNSSNGTSAKLYQRFRQRRAMSTEICKARAICVWFFPAAANKMMRALFTNCCGVEWRRINSTSSSRAGDSKTIGASLGPGSSFLASRLFDLSHSLCIVYAKS